MTQISQETATRIHAAAERARLKDGVHVELSPRRVRAYLDDKLIVDSEKVLLVFETKRPPVYWFPTGDVRMDLLTLKEPGDVAVSATRRWRSNTGGRVEENLAWSYVKPTGELAPWRATWSSTGTPSTDGTKRMRKSSCILRDPYTRVDTVHSSRHVRVRG